MTSDFSKMLQEVIDGNEITQKCFAEKIGISSSFLCDLLQGKRNASPKIVNKICKYMGRGKIGKRVWHEAGARSNGWEL